MMKTIIMAAAIVGLGAVPATAQELLTNGNFETGSFAGWSAQSQLGSDGVLTISQPGTRTPVIGRATAANPSGGSFYAITDQSGPGAYALSQGFIVPLGATSVTLSFQAFVNNHGTVSTVNASGLDYTAEPNQHVRFDLLTGSADPFSIAAADVLTNFYLGTDAGANPNPYTSYTFDISSFVTAGQSYQIRFGEVDNRGQLNMGIDNVSVFAVGVPEPASWALMIGGFGLVGGTMRRRSTRVAFA